jgi:hypothetical protein
MEASGDHQMKDYEELVVEAKDYALSQPIDGQYWPPDEGVELRFDRAEQKGRLDEDRLQRLRDNARPDRLGVHRDVRQLRHVEKRTVVMRRPAGAVRAPSPG